MPDNMIGDVKKVIELGQKLYGIYNNNDPADDKFGPSIAASISATAKTLKQKAKSYQK